MSLENVRLSDEGLERLVDGEWRLWKRREMPEKTAKTLSDLPRLRGPGSVKEGVKTVGGPNDQVVRVGSDWLAVRTLVDPPTDEEAARGQRDTDKFERTMRIA